MFFFTVELEDGAVAGNTGCLVEDGDMLLRDELGFGNAEIMGLHTDSGEYMHAHTNTHC